MAITAIDTAKGATNAQPNWLRVEVERLAAEAFHHHLISGYGDGELPGEYQIVIQGKPRHYSLEYAHTLLANLVARHVSFTD